MTVFFCIRHIWESNGARINVELAEEQKYARASLISAPLGHSIKMRQFQRTLNLSMRRKIITTRSLKNPAISMMYNER